MDAETTSFMTRMDCNVQRSWVEMTADGTKRTCQVRWIDDRARQPLP
jgi:hypothetical protein